MVNYVQGMPAESRGNRRPQHKFNVIMRPWQLVPTMIAAVVPGETFTQGLVQARVVSDPLKNSITGWWLEQFLFYVPMTQLVSNMDQLNFLVDPDAVLPAQLTASASKPAYYVRSGDANWLENCVREIVRWYFRPEGYDLSINPSPGDLIGDYFAVNVGIDDWTNSLMAAAQSTDYDESLTVGADDSIKASEIEALMRKYYAERQYQMTDMSWEDYLASFGVKSTLQDQGVRGKPELLRYNRSWTYPANTVDPVTGAPNSVVTWALQERADKDRFFKEPGFVVGLMCTRPKVYWSKQVSSSVNSMKSFADWMPAVLKNMPGIGIKNEVAGQGPLGSNAVADYTWNIRDAFVHGDQFTNTTPPQVALPSATNRLYPTATDADALFTTPAGKNYLRADGIYSLGFKSHISDVDPYSTRAG